MTSNNTKSPLILILVVFLTLSQFSFYSIADPKPPKVYFFDDIPMSENPVVTITCKLKSGVPILSTILSLNGQRFIFDASITNDIYVCYAEWNNSTASFNAYDPIQEDKGHPIVYWSIQDEAIRKSWDLHKWTFVTNWTTT